MQDSKPAEFLIDRQYEFFTPIDIMATFAGLVVISILVYLRIRANSDKPYYKYYGRAFYFKMFLVVANITFYIVKYGAGGDSIGFWDGAVKLNNLFFYDPIYYFKEIFQVGFEGVRNPYVHFNQITGYPDGHIYEEESSFFISKVASFFGFFTFKGYILMSIIFAYITTNISMRLFEFIRQYKLHTDQHLALAIFFIPSLSFWCAGISKDTLMWWAVCYFIVNIFRIITPEQQHSWRNWAMVLISVYVMLKVRSFMVVTVMVPLLYAYSARIGKKFGAKSLERTGIRLLVAILGITGILIFFQTPIAKGFIEEAAIIHQDMTTNKSYTGAKYNLEVTDYSPAGMVKAFPASVVAGFFRPFIWEALTFSFIFDGIQSTVLIYFMVRFLLHHRFRKRIEFIRNNEILIYGFFFALILAYFAGFTSILFGVLVRFKAPVLPFLVLVLTGHVQWEAAAQSESGEQRAENESGERSAESGPSMNSGTLT
ncbi:MAG: hypothetical protein LW688_03855 [Cryomorphaceae bacterium]|nr:hypothetical protein [Cryomorphaceae bacterium]